MVWKPATIKYFYINNRTKYNLDYKCIECNKIYSHNHHKKYYKTHNQERINKAREWARNNPDKVRASYIRNREKILQSTKRSRERNSEYKKHYDREYYIKNKKHIQSYIKQFNKEYYQRPEIKERIQKRIRQHGFTREKDYKNAIQYWALNVKEKANFKCESCGTSKRLESHHKNNRSKYPEQAFDIDNGLCLCDICHRFGENSLHKILGINTTKQTTMEWLNEQKTSTR